MFSDSNSPTAPFVSVIIPCYGECSYLSDCLSALELQTLPVERFEVILVDNGMSVPAQKIIENRSVAITVVTEETPGSYAARNTGILCAKGSILAFTDSDCIPDSEWLRLGVERFQSIPHCGFVAGKVKFSFKSPDRPNFIELYDSLMHLRQETNVRQFYFGLTCNLFSRKSVFEHLGKFDQTLFSGGDAEWGQRVHEYGYSQIYAEEVIILHPARHCVREFINKTRRLAGGELMFQHRKGRSVLRIMLGQVRVHCKRMLIVTSNKNVKNVGTRLILFVFVLILLLVKTFEYILLSIGKDPVR